MQVFYGKMNVYFTNVASIEAIKKCLEAVGPEWIIFGSEASGTPEPSTALLR